MPYLNFVEKTDQEQLCKILPKLYEDLCKEDTSTLKDYQVPWTHVNMVNNASSSDLDKHILARMCIDAAKGVKMQCEREYWLEGTEGVRATQVHKLTAEERKNLPTNNLNTERHLAKFGYLASQSAARSNRFFKAQRIRDDMVFSSTPSTTETEKVSTKVLLQTAKALDVMEKKWTAAQKAKKKEKIKHNIEKRQRHNDYIDVVLKKCKTHGGPLTSSEEMQTFLSQYSGDKNMKSYLRQEVQYQKLTHPRDSDARPHLYKVNKMSMEELTENLIILFGADEEEEHASIIFPTEDDIFLTLSSGTTSADEQSETDTESPKYTQDQPLAVMWDLTMRKKSQREWFIGFYLDMNSDGTFRVNHLIREGDKDSTWLAPIHSDIQDVCQEQVVPVEVVGEWNYNGRTPKFILSNMNDIKTVFNDIFM